MASLQHIDEPIIGLFYSGPTGYCDCVSVMKESRFSSYFCLNWMAYAVLPERRCFFVFSVATYLFVTVCESFPEDFEDFCLTGTLFPVCWFAISILAFCPTSKKFVNHKSKQQPVPCSGIFKERVFQVMWYPIKLRQKLIVQWKAVTLLRYTSGK